MACFSPHLQRAPVGSRLRTGSSALRCASQPQLALHKRRPARHGSVATRASGREIGGGGGEMGDMGARDPTQQEVEFGFQDRVLYNSDTDHIRMIPSKARALISLVGRKCTPLEAGAQPLLYKDAELFRKQVLDWKFAENDTRLRRVWQAKDAAAAKELSGRITQLATAEGHTATTQAAADNSVTVELWTSALGGLTENDFIIAAKLDAMPMSDLIVTAKKRTYFF